MLPTRKRISPIVIVGDHMVTFLCRAVSNFEHLFSAISSMVTVMSQHLYRSMHPVPQYPRLEEAPSCLVVVPFDEILEIALLSSPC